jgi:hypothetical protein
MEIKSSQIVYSEHHYDECFEFKDGSGRVAEGNAIGYEIDQPNGYDDQPCVKLILFDDIKYSEYNHDYWDNYELEHDSTRIII